LTQNAVQRPLGRITSSTKSTLEKMQDMYIELFLIDDLQYNITKHSLQPRFEKLEYEEGENFKKKYGVKFPVLRVNMPISRFYDYKKGDVILIHRKDGYITYRIVK
jgi:DNA-directed RNA polymerase I, II, and III subunit RPABC1